MAVPAAVLERGGSLQPWHAVGGVAGWAAIAPTQAVAMTAVFVLVLDADALAAKNRRVVAEIRVCGLAGVGRRSAGSRQAGGGTIKRMQSIMSDDDSDEDAASSVFDSRGAPSRLEKLLLLRDTKMLRFVPARFLPLLADVAEVEVLQPKRKIATRGSATDASSTNTGGRCCRARFGRRQPRAPGRARGLVWQHGSLG